MIAPSLNRLPKVGRFAGYVLLSSVLLLSTVAGSCGGLPDTENEPMGEMAASHSVLDFGATETSRVLQITNSTTESVVWQAEVDRPWISLSSANGTATSPRTTVTISVDRTLVTDGDHSGSVRLRSSLGTQVVSISMRKDSH